HLHHQDAAGAGAVEAGGEHRQGIGRAEQDQGRHGDGEAGRGDRQAEDARPELRFARVGDQDGRRHRALDGSRRNRVSRRWEGRSGGPSEPQRSFMRKHGKKYSAARAQVAPDRNYSIEEAIPLVQKVKFAKFDETVELTLRLGVDPKHADQMVRGTVVLPHGLGKTKRVLAIAGGEKQKEAQEAGADFVGGEEVVERITGGWIDFDAVVATPDMMRAVGKLGKVLGPRG